MILETTKKKCKAAKIMIGMYLKQAGHFAEKAMLDKKKFGHGEK